MKKLFLLPCIFITTLTAMAQNNKPLSLNELIPGGKNYSHYKVNLPQQLQWYNDSPIYLDNDAIKSINFLKKGKEDIILNQEDKIRIGINDDGISKIEVCNNSPELLAIHTDNSIVLYNANTKEVVHNYSILHGSANYDIAPNTHFLAYTKANNLYVAKDNLKHIVVTDDMDGDIVNGQAVHRNEFGINNGTFWAPNGSLLAFYRMDQSMVTNYPLVNVDARIATLKNIKYPMAGMTSHEVQVGVFDVINQKTIFLETGLPKDKYLTNIAWSPNSKHIYIAELNRGQDTCQLNRYNAITGKFEKTIFVETHKKYVEPENPILFLPNNPENFIWQSKRNGHNHLYEYNIEGDLVRQLTDGNWDVVKVVGFTDAGKSLIYISTEGSPMEQHIFKLNLNNRDRIRLSRDAGVHSALLSNDGKYILDKYSSKNNPGKIDVIDVKKDDFFEIFEAKNPFEGIILPEIKLGTLKANDGRTDLYYRLTLPVDFDSTKKYPLIVYVYGGPHSQLVNNSWMGQARGWDLYMAQEGYIVFTLDNRGTNYRGLDFENITHRQLGVIETEDQMTGIEYMKSLPYVDSDRIGVHGWSYGGFMTLNLMLRHPDTFRVGVAGGPVTDWKYYEIMYGERYMDGPSENPKGYSESSMINRAGDLQGRLLLIHGDEDPTVVMQHSLEFLHAAIKQGTHPDFFVYPGHGHNMIGKDRVHLHEHITRYFDDFLK